MEQHISPNDVIDAIGGTAETARLCNIEPQAVSQWRRNGIPPARLMYLKLLRPDVFEGEQKQVAKEAA